MPMESPPPDRAPSPTPAPPAPDPAPPAGAVPFRVVAPGTYEANLAVSEPDTFLEHVKRAVFGVPIPERLAGRERLDRARALAILSSDALSSVAYGTEASLAVLVSAGAAALSANLGIGLVTAALMLVVGNSYRQTIHAYPGGGGSYTVARENLGTLPGLVAAAALLLDYLLTVAVSVAAGVDAISSVFPAITPVRLEIELGLILLLVLVNLRGVRSAGTVFAAPTYLFLASFGAMLVFGLARAFARGGPTAALHPAAPAGAAVTPLLILTAFAAGCSAMTGVEAISNGVPAFAGRSPREQARHAAQTLALMITLLASFFLGTTYLAWRAGAAPSPSGEPTVTAQIARFAFAGVAAWPVDVVQAATLLILAFAANTSFAGFPRLASILARDGFVPAAFADRGERLAFTVGIASLGLLSALVLWVFQGDVVALINLYALGVFTAFTLSQAGMVVRWVRRRRAERGWFGRLLANGIGALATAVVTGVIAYAKFDRGAWVIVVLIPTLVVLFLAIRRYYARARLLALPATPPAAADVVVMPILAHEPPPGTAVARPGSAGQARQEAWARAIRQELAYAARIGPELVVVGVVSDRQEAEAFRVAWERAVGEQTGAALRATRVEALVSPYRTIVLPLAHFVIWQTRTEWAGRRVAVLLPRELHAHWWEWPLRRRVGDHLRAHLRGRAGRPGAPVTLVDVPYRLAGRRATA
jgi:amino acid transporter